MIAGSQLDTMADDGQVGCDTEVWDDDYVMIQPGELGSQSPIAQQPPTFALGDAVTSDHLDPRSSPPSSDEGILPLNDVRWGDFIEEEYLWDSAPDIEKEYEVIAPDDYGPVSTDNEGVDVCLAALEIQPSAAERRRHQRNRTCRRTNLEPPRCAYCGVTFPRLRELNRHVKRHERPLRCTRCSASKAEQRDLNRHYRAFHPAFAQRVLGLRPVAPFPCGCCGTTFTRRDNLKKHERRYNHGNLKSKL